MVINSLDDVDSDIEEINNRYSKFYDLTFLYPGKYHNDLCIRNKYAETYYKKVKEYIKNNNEFKDGDIIFIGSTYESRQYYGFATILGDRYINHEYPDLLKIAGVYYKYCINEINIFYQNKFPRDGPFFGPNNIIEAIENKHYDFE